MHGFTYLKDVVTLKLNQDICIGCGMCTQVCPHSVFTMQDKKAYIQDKDACMECGACAQNCPVQAIYVRPGVGCAYGIIRSGVLKKSCACEEIDFSKITCCGKSDNKSESSCC